MRQAVDVGLDSLVLSYQEERTIKTAGIDPKPLPTSPHGDDIPVEAYSKKRKNMHLVAGLRGSCTFVSEMAVSETVVSDSLKKMK